MSDDEPKRTIDQAQEEGAPAKRPRIEAASQTPQAIDVDAVVNALMALVEANQAIVAGLYALISGINQRAERSPESSPTDSEMLKGAANAQRSINRALDQLSATLDEVRVITRSIK